MPSVDAVPVPAAAGSEDTAPSSLTLAEDPEVLITADGVPALGAPGLPVVGRGRPSPDLFHRTFSLDWGFGCQLGLTSGSWDSLLLWMDVF